MVETVEFILFYFFNHSFKGVGEGGNHFTSSRQGISTGLTVVGLL